MTGNSAEIGVWESQTMKQIGVMPGGENKAKIDSLAVIKDGLIFGGFEAFYRRHLPDDPRNLSSYGLPEKFSLCPKMSGLVREISFCERRGDIFVTSSEGTGTFFPCDGRGIILFKSHSKPITAIGTTSELLVTDRKSVV